MRWHTDNRRHAQIPIYNDEMESRIRPDGHDWLLVCDLDEFVYTPRPGDTIQGFLSGVSPDVGDIWIKWLTFGSAGHKMQPAEGVIAGFRWRARAPVLHAYADSWKSIVRIAAVDVLNAHIHRMDPSFVTIRFDAENEYAVAAAPLRLNHYAIQSFDRFCRVKMVPATYTVQKTTLYGTTGTSNDTTSTTCWTTDCTTNQRPCQHLRM